MADERDALLKELKAALAALADDAETTLPRGYLDFCARHLLDASGPDPMDAQRDRFCRIEALAKAANQLVSAFDALSDDEADDLCADYTVIQAHRSIATRATQLAALRPRRKGGRRPKLIASDVAGRALTVFEIITRKRASISVDAISETAGGPYLGLVETAFRILSIRASAEHFARKAISEHRTSRPHASDAD